MPAIRIRQKLDSETLTLPQLRPFVGKEVEIVISDVSPTSHPTASRQPSRSPLAGSILRDDDDPFGPAVPQSIHHREGRARFSALALWGSWD